MIKRLFLTVVSFMFMVGLSYAGNPMQYPIFQAINADGDPVSGGLVYTYTVGTTTAKAAYTNEALTVAATNPIVLDSKGEAVFYLDGLYKINVKTSAGVQVDNFPIDNVGSQDFDLVDDLTPQLGGQLDVNGKSLGDGTLEILSFSETSSAVNEITIKNAATTNSPQVQATGDDSNISLKLVPKGTGAIDFSRQYQGAIGTDVASGSALAILTDGNYFNVTGTTNIDTIATSGKVGTIITLKHAGVLDLVYDAADLITLTGADVTTAAGDHSTWIEYAAGDWRMIDYERAKGINASLVLLYSVTASSSATIDLDTGITFSDYDEIQIHLQHVIPATDNAVLWIRTSANAGVAYDEGVADYGWAMVLTGTGTSDQSDAQIEIAAAVGSSANEYGVSGIVYTIDPSAAVYTTVYFTGQNDNTSNATTTVHASGKRLSAAAVDGIRFLYSTGAIESGEFKVYGVSKQL